MSTEAIVLFTAAALALAAYMVLSSARTSRLEREETALARARAEDARVEAELARRQRVLWERRLAEQQREAILVGGDPRGLHDGLGLYPDRSGRFLREAGASAPTPDPVPPGPARPRG
jgi:Flp pilus assembly protein TadB